MGYEGNAVFADILMTGATKLNSKDNYSQNYDLFKEFIENYSTKEPELFYWFIRNVLNKVIILPITADTQDTALTIFSTLNDRGLALSDADIFKAKIYNRLDDIRKKEFVEQWRQLDETASATGENLQRLFYYYMFYQRALENDRDTTTPGLRKYYARKDFEKLYNPSIMDDLNSVLNIWIVVNNRVEITDESWTQNIEIRQVLDALSSYPNEFWKYPVVIFYLHHRSINDFDKLFLEFLKRFLAELSARYVIMPTINAVKRSIVSLNAEIIVSPTPIFNFNVADEDELREKIKTSHRSIIRTLLKIIAYNHQDDLLPINWEIEHILPQKWQSSFFPNTSDNEVKELVEHIGNKIPFEKKLNIIASNGYFAKKKESYSKTNVKILQMLSNQKKKWDLEDIHERDIRISDELIETLTNWGLNKVPDSVELSTIS
jgi:hypothetical protein